MYFVTLGHKLASALASPLVIRRQLFPPNPSETERVIGFGPHHAGVPAVALPAGLADAVPVDPVAWLGVADEAPPDGEALFEHAETAIKTAPRMPIVRVHDDARVAT
jgi:hypothetical protein